MISVSLYTSDTALEPLLSSGLGGEFRFFADDDEGRLMAQAEREDCLVAVLDLNSREDAPAERIEVGHRLIAARITLLVLADDGMRSAANELVRAGAYGYCRRPPSLRDFRSLLRGAHEIAHRNREFEPVQDRLQQGAAERFEMTGSSDAMQDVFRLIDRVASIAPSVLICGETGTGKELVARAIHQRGSRSTRPFVAVACGAIPETLIEAELFGHEKGAFTGTVGAREGFFEQAKDGTLFLDEIGELSLYTQVKLLRALQEREFSRLGSSRLIPLRARLIFATHRDLGEMVSQGKFRQDLYYRINVMNIEVPSLRDRLGDIPQLAAHFLRMYSGLFRKNVAAVDADAMETLQDYHWPGNVRELENVIQRAIIVTSGTILRTNDLSANLRGDAAPSEHDCIPGGSFEEQLREYKVKLVEIALRESSGNKTLAARRLGLSRAYLHRLVRLPQEAGVRSPVEISKSIAS